MYVCVCVHAWLCVYVCGTFTHGGKCNAGEKKGEPQKKKRQVGKKCSFSLTKKGGWW
jgi:hypothetical protein